MVMSGKGTLCNLPYANMPQDLAANNWRCLCAAPVRKISHHTSKSLLLPVTTMDLHTGKISVSYSTIITETTERDIETEFEGAVERIYSNLSGFFPNVSRWETKDHVAVPLEMKIHTIYGSPYPATTIKLYPREIVDAIKRPLMFEAKGFLDFPQELRHMIYQRLIDAPKILRNAINEYSVDHIDVKGLHCHEQGMVLSLRKTCRTVHAEVVDYVYKHVGFVFRRGDDLQGYLAMLAEGPTETRRKTFRKVVLHLGQDRWRVTKSVRLQDENTDISGIDGHGSWLKYPIEKRTTIASASWMAGIRTLLNAHNVQDLAFVAKGNVRGVFPVMRPWSSFLFKSLRHDDVRVQKLELRGIDLEQSPLPDGLLLIKGMKLRWERSN